MDVVTVLERLMGRGEPSVPMALKPPFKKGGGVAWIARAPWRFPADNVSWPLRPRTCLYENGTRIAQATPSHASIRNIGGGLYSFGERKILFSTSDNSDPNLNGRQYHIDLTLDPDECRDALLKVMCGLWDRHPQGAFFRARGGDEIPPPLFCNIGLTNKCNLRCEICGSQKFLDATGVRRRHMDIGLFEDVAQVLFPSMAEVEMNSQGDPLLHPQIDRVLEVIAQHRCEIKVQTNGTLFSPRIIDLLSQNHGTVMLSLDAVGSAFDEVRRGGNWAKAEPGLNEFLRRREPGRMAVGVYPTLTRRSLPYALDVVRWAAVHDIDEVSFHRYIPIQNSFEEAPEAAELSALADRLRSWARKQNVSMQIRLDGTLLAGDDKLRRRTFADEFKWSIGRLVQGTMYPMDAGGKADPIKICVAPDHYVEVGLDGQVGACCRAQDVNLGYATSPEAFASTWFGHNYRIIRDSLRRDARGAFPLPNCEGCIAAFSPSSLGERKAVDYHHGKARGLDYSDWDEIPIDAVQKERGHCFIAAMSPGADLAEYVLFEDDRPLGPGDAMHDDIRQHGGGRFSLWGQQVYFSTSDNSDPRRNGRRYHLIHNSRVGIQGGDPQISRTPTVGPLTGTR
jgi:MoaA/NifB/PqqE/SkfB family radical SAM enzyme